MLAVRPPEYWPRLSYFALMDRVERFVLADTFQYSRQSFQNRAKLRTPQGWQWISVPLRGGQHGRPVCDVAIEGVPYCMGKHWRAFTFNYHATPFFAYYEDAFRPLFDAEWRFRPNIEADPATQVGVAASLAFGRGLDPGGWRFNARLDATAETGDFTFVRPAATASLGFPLPGRFLGAAEVAGGTTVSDAAEGEPRAPAQSLWYLGGSPTVRGFDGAAASGADFLRARLEVGTAFPAARLALVGDAGWAGDCDTLDSGDVLTSAGIGASFLDGLLRLDLARTIRPSAAWRLDLYLDALF